MLGSNCFMMHIFMLQRGDDPTATLVEYLATVHLLPCDLIKHKKKFLETKINKKIAIQIPLVK